MRARRMRVARDGEPADDPAHVVVDGDEDCGVRMPTNGLQVAAFVGGASPGLRRQQPFAGLPADGRREPDELVGVGRLGGTDRDHGTTTP